LSNRIGTVNDLLGVKPVSSYMKPYTFSKFIGEEKEEEKETTI